MRHFRSSRAIEWTHFFILTYPKRTLSGKKIKADIGNDINSRASCYFGLTEATTSFYVDQINKISFWKEPDETP